MAEVGLLPLARVAREVAPAVLPPYRSRFSQHPFSQPQWWAVLCRMRYEDGTFRETEVRLREQGAWRRVWRLRSVPAYTTRYRFRKRLEEATRDPAWGEAARRRGTVGRRRRARGAVDATGRAPGAVSTFWVRRRYPPTHPPLPGRHGLQWRVAVDGERQWLLSPAARRGPGNDCASLPSRGEAAKRVAPIGPVLAAAEFDRERNPR